MMLHDFEESRGFNPGELEPYGIRIDGETVIIPTLGSKGAWYERKHRPGGHPKYESPVGVESHLYNPGGIGPSTPDVWLAEGEFDTLSLLTVGVAAVGVLGAGNFNRHWQLLFASAEIVLAFDPDTAGMAAMDKLTELWPPNHPISRFDPSPYEDLNDWFKRDRAGFEKAVKEW